MGASIRPETDEEIVDRLIKAGATDDEIMEILREVKQPSAMSRFMRGIGTGAKSVMMKMASPSAGPGARPTTTFDQIRKEQKQFEATRPTSEQLGTAGKIGEFVGEVGAGLPIDLAISGGLSGLGRAPIEKLIGPASNAATKFSAFLRGAAAGVPANVAAGVATTAIIDPEAIATKEGLAKTAAFSTLGTLFDGYFGVAARGQGIAALAEQAKTSRTSARDLANRIDAFMENYNSILADPFSQIKPKPLGIVVEEGLGIREMKPVRKGRLIPNTGDVQGYATEIAADMAQREELTKRMMGILDNMKRGTHTSKQVEELAAVMAKHDGLSLKISEDINKLGMSAEEVRNLILGGTKTTPRTVIKTAGQVKPNMENPVLRVLNPAIEEAAPRKETFKVRPGASVLPNNPATPGAGTESPYAYIAPDPDADVLAPVVATKVEGTGNQFAGLTPAQQKIAERIDFGNKDVAEMEKNQRYLLDTWWKRADFKLKDFLRPLKEVNEKVDELAGKFLHLSIKQQGAINDAIYIPDGQGGYTRGAESLLPMARRLGGDPEKLMKFQLYAHARQTTSGILTPFDEEASAAAIRELEQQFPDFKDVFDNMHMPLVADLLKMVDGYELMPAGVLEKLTRNPEYVPLLRSIFADESTTLTRRTNPTSQIKVEDYWHAMMANIRGMVRAGERVQVLRELAKARKADDSLAGAIDFVEYEDPEGFKEAMAALPDDIPEQIRDALARAFAKQKSNTYSFLMDGKRVSIQVNDEIRSSLDLMQYSFPKVYDPQNATKVEKFLGAPLRATASVEKAATNIYSIYRDLFGFGVPLDAAEIAVNASARGLKFNALIDPVKGFFALYRGDPFIRDLVGHAGGLGSRYANPMAEEAGRSADDLFRSAKASGIKLRIMNPKQAMVEFAGNLSNASRAGLALRNKEGRSVAELATIYNTILGDPARTGAALGSLAKYTGFMNYPIQATSAQLSSLAKSPQNLAFFLARTGGQLVAPTLALSYLGKDDPDIMKMSNDPSGRRFMYLRNPFDEAELLAIPKPQGPAGVLFVTLPQMLIQELKDSGNNDVLEQVGKAAVQSVMPNFVPLTWNLGISLATGKSVNLASLGSIDITPESRQGLVPEMAGPSNTLNASNALAQLSGIDAGKWEKVFRTFLIGTSYDIVQNIDYKLGEGKGVPPRANPLLSVPGIRRVEASTAGSKYVGDFYEEYDKVSKAMRSFNYSVNNGQAEGAVDIYDRYKDDMTKAAQLEPYFDSMRNLNSQINLIRMNEFLSVDEKREELDKLQRLRIDVAKEAMQGYKK
jgi:ribosomal protein S7